MAQVYVPPQAGIDMCGISAEANRGRYPRNGEHYGKRRAINEGV